MGRLIFVPQLPIHMRYQEWWLPTLIERMSDFGWEVITLGETIPRSVSPNAFSSRSAAIENECRQIDEYMRIEFRPGDVLFHADLSYPGIFHSVLAHHRPECAVVFCHATSQNNHDIFSHVAEEKWYLEVGAQLFYDKVLVATNYSKNKIKLGHALYDTVHSDRNNVVVMHGLPYPPSWIRDGSHSPIPDEFRPYHFVSVARPTPQKVDTDVEMHLEKMSGFLVIRKTFNDWSFYWDFLRSSNFMVITACEETYGYQVVDALLQGCVPIAPRAYSYPELLPDYLLYNPDGFAEERAKEILKISQSEEALSWVGRPDLRPDCDNGALFFWRNLHKELTTWQ